MNAHPLFTRGLLMNLAPSVIRHSMAVALAIVGAAPPTAQAAVTIDMVTVGNPGNANDPLTGNVYGAVAYDYQIGQYEVTIQQYTDFLNAVAARDPYGLYNKDMGSDARVAGIRRSGSSGSYTYRVNGPSGTNPAGGDSPGNRPITYLDWFDAARFANWMHNGQGAGSTETGAYTLNGAKSGNAVAVNPGAKFYIPTESQWYKAAYYSPALNSGAGGYYLYATQSNSAPGNIIGAAPNQANYYADSGTYSLTQSPFLVNNQNYLTNAGAFPNSASFYGTFDQGGNAYEWNDLTGAAGALRALRSGFFQSNQGDLTVFDRYVAVPVAEFSGSGFRLAGAADPGSPPLIAMQVIGDGGGSIQDATTGLNCASACQESFANGGAVTLSAVTPAGSVFKGWGGACRGLAPQCQVNAGQATRVTAAFVTSGSNLLLVQTAGSGEGAVFSKPAGIDCGADCDHSATRGAKVKLTAKPTAGSRFVTWTGACAPRTTPKCTVKLGSDQFITAVFRVRR